LFSVISLAGILLSAGCSSGSGGEMKVSADRGALPLEQEAHNQAGVVLTDVTVPAGIGFHHSYGDQQFSNLIEAAGGGVAFLDYDQDGWLDLYLASGKYYPGLSSGEEPRGQNLNRLYRNRGDGTFEEVTEQAGVGLPESYSMGLAVADFNNDGFPDIFVCGYHKSTLLENRRDGTFADVTLTAGVANSDLTSIAATWLDYDRDGLLDLYVSSYIAFDPDYDQYYSPDGFPGPLAYQGQPDRLFRNLGSGRFRDVSAEVGLSELKGRGMSVISADYDLDGFPDLYVTNDATENFLLHNDAGTHFSQVSEDAGVGYNGMGDSTASMGADLGDYDRDGRLDLFVSDNSIGSLYRNEGDGLFMDQVVESGIAMRSAQYVGWGSFFFDLDNDGDLDIFKTNSDLSRLFGQEDQVFLNDGKGGFHDIASEMGDYFRKTLLGRGAAYADYDNDGDLDIVVSNIAGPAVLLRNDGGNRKNWLALKFKGKDSNRDGTGAVVRISIGENKLVLFTKASSGYLSCSDPRLHVGLDGADRIDEIEIDWPSGRKQILRDVNANQILTVEEPEA